MSTYSILYILFAVILLAYTLRNRLDLYCVCSVCFVVYSMYCAIGIGISGFYRPRLSPLLYYCVYGQMLIILIFGMVINRVNKRRRRRLEKVDLQTSAPSKKAVSNKTMDLTFYIYTAIIFIFAMVNIISVGFSGFASGKIIVWEKTNVLFIVSLYGAYPSFAYGLHYNKKWIWIPSLFVEVTIFFAGSRAFLATMIIIFLCEKGSSIWKKHKKNIKLLIFGALAVVFLLIYRMVDQAIMAGDMMSVIKTLSQPSAWLTALEFNEPRVIIANYDYVLTQDFHLPWQDVLYRIFDFIPGFSFISPLKLSYGEYFSDWLQASVHGSAGVGGTIWGESFAMFGLGGIFVNTLIWLIFVKACNRHLDYPREYSPFVISAGTYLSWYINRLDFNRVGQSLKVLLFCFLIWAVIYMLLGGRISLFGRSFAIRGRSAREER